jgi:hypothetical protein
MSDARAYLSGPVGAGGCQISAVAQRNACRRKAVWRRWTGKRWVALCARCDDRHGAIIGTLDVTERTVIVGALGAVEATVTEPAHIADNETEG